MYPGSVRASVVCGVDETSKSIFTRNSSIDRSKGEVGWRRTSGSLTLGQWVVRDPVTLLTFSDLESSLQNLPILLHVKPNLLE